MNTFHQSLKFLVKWVPLYLKYTLYCLKFSGKPLEPSIESVNLGPSNVSAVWTQSHACFSACMFQYRVTLLDWSNAQQRTVVTSQLTVHITELRQNIHYEMQLEAICNNYTSRMISYNFSLITSCKCISTI